MHTKQWITTGVRRGVALTSAALSVLVPTVIAQRDARQAILFRVGDPNIHMPVPVTSAQTYHIYGLPDPGAEDTNQPRGLIGSLIQQLGLETVGTDTVLVLRRSDSQVRPDTWNPDTIADTTIFEARTLALRTATIHRHYDGYIETYRVSGRRLFWTARSRAGRTYAAELQLDEPAFYPSSFPLVVLGLANRFTRAFTFRVPRLYQDSTRERLVIDTAEGRVIGTAQVSLGNGSKVLVWVVRFDDTTYWVRKSAPEIVGWLRRLGEEERALKYVHDK